MVRSQLQHATEKIADGDANCLYAAGLSSLILLKNCISVQVIII